MEKKGYDFSNVAVLIVEDSSYMRKIIKLILNGLGFRKVLEAEDGVEAFRLFRNQPIDMILIDWEMPILNGVEFIRMVRTSTDSPNPYVPMVMLSGHSEMQRIVEARDAGVNEFVVKPLSAQTLYARLVSVVERPRPFVRTKQFFGPDRRRRKPESFKGSERRAGMLEQLKELGSNALSQEDVDNVIYKV